MNESFVVVSHGMEKESGIRAQDFVYENFEKLPIQNLVMINGFLGRKYRPALAMCAELTKKVKPSRSLKHPLGILNDHAHQCSNISVENWSVDYPLPTLSIGAELDGVVRITRIAEAFQNQEPNRFPVVVIQGMRHSSITNQDHIENDLPSSLQGSITNDNATSTVSDLILSYVRRNETLLQHLKTFTQELLNPISDIFSRIEGSWFFNSNVDEEHGSSLWGAQAQINMIEPLPSNWSVVSTSNEFRLLTDEEKIPPYYREKHRASIEIILDGELSTSTISQLRYIKVSVTEAAAGLNGYAIIKEEFNSVLNLLKDDGKDYVSALEIATKMVSRQKAFNVTGDGNSPDSLDDGDRCAAINRKAIEFALKQGCSEQCRSRYESQGIPLRAVPDRKPFPPAGPWWIFNYLSFQHNDTSHTMDVSSWYAFYSTSGLKYGAGNHYCKLLSPARALEWIMIDSLRHV